MPTLHKNGGVYAPAIATRQKQAGVYVPNVGIFSKQDAAYQSVFGGGGGGGGVDEQWADVKLLYTGGGVDGGTDILDQSSFARAVTRVGAVFDTAQTTVYSSSILFGGEAGSSRLAVGSLSLTLPFTIELLIRPTAVAPIGVVDTAPSAGGTLRNYPAGIIERQSGAAVVFDPPVNVWSWNQLIFTADTNKILLTYFRNGALIRSGHVRVGDTTIAQGNFTVGQINNGGDGSLAAHIAAYRVTDAIRAASAMPTSPLPTTGP